MSKIIFDDFTEDKENGGIWACICGDCVKKHRIPHSMLDDAGMGVCSVKGCTSEADYYIDFPPSATIRESMLEISIDLAGGKDGGGL